jgi:hypothetical protein
VILRPKYLELLLERLKDVECRLNQRAVPPVGAVGSGDLLWLKRSSGPVEAVAEVEAVRLVERPGMRGAQRIRRELGRRIWGEPAFYRMMATSRYVTLVWVADLRRFEPFWIRKQDRRSWVVLPGPLSPGQIIPPG